MTTTSSVFVEKKCRKRYEVTYTDSRGERCFIPFNRCKTQAHDFFNKVKKMYGKNKGGVFLDVYDEANNLLNFLSYYENKYDMEAQNEIYKRNQNQS